MLHLVKTYLDNLKCYTVCPLVHAQHNPFHTGWVPGYHSPCSGTQPSTARVTTSRPGSPC